MFCHHALRHLRRVGHHPNHGCEVDFENHNYTVLTSWCKGPNYPPKGFVAKPKPQPDGSVNSLYWKCYVPDKAGVGNKDFVGSSRRWKPHAQVV